MSDPSGTQPSGTQPSGTHPTRPERPRAVRALFAIGRALRTTGRSFLDVIFTFASVEHGVNPAARDQADQLAQSDRRQRTNREYRP